MYMPPEMYREMQTDYSVWLLLQTHCGETESIKVIWTTFHGEIYERDDVGRRKDYEENQASKEGI